LLSLLLITNYNAIMKLKEEKQRLEAMEKRYNELEKQIQIRESELELLRKLMQEKGEGVY
jgi:type III secretory pathway component EscV